MSPATATAARAATGRPDMVAAVVPAAGEGATSCWRRLITAVDPAAEGSFALTGASLEPGAAYELSVGALVVACDRRDDGTRTVRLLRAGDGGLDEIKAWELKAKLGKRVVDYTARRLAPGAGSHRAVALEALPNRWDGWCTHCRTPVPAATGRVVHDGERHRVVHLPGQCPPPPETITPNRFGEPCFACGGWVQPRTGVAIRLPQPRPTATGAVSHYQAMHTAPCPADVPPGPPNRVEDWCADCGEIVHADEGYWLDDELRHTGDCPAPSVRGPQWTIRRRSWEAPYEPGQVRRVRIDLRRGGELVPMDAPGRRVLAEQYVELVALVVDTVERGDWRQRARVCPATPAQAGDLLAGEVVGAVEARPDVAGFRARFTVERLLPHRSRLVRLRMVGAGFLLHPWLAEITGRDPDYRWERRFLRPDRDYTHANRAGTQGVDYSWTLIANRVYQACYHVSRTTTARVYLRATAQGDVVETGRREVEAWLNCAPVWPDH